MLNTIALPRRGNTTVNNALDDLLEEVGWLTTGQLADLITVDGILGHPDSLDAPAASPVGRWVLAQLQAEGIPAVVHSWVGGELAVYDTHRWLIGEVRIPEHHTLYELDCEVNDLDRPELCWQGENDPR